MDGRLLGVVKEIQLGFRLVVYVTGRLFGVDDPASVISIVGATESVRVVNALGSL